MSFSEYSSPTFVHRKSFGKLKTPVDLRRLNHLPRHEYLKSSFEISSMTGSTNHFSGKTLFRILDFSQAYHCVQSADNLSVQLFALKIALRIFSINCLAQGSIKSATEMSSTVKRYLDPCLSVIVCTQFLDDLVAAVTEFDDLYLPCNLFLIFETIRSEALRTQLRVRRNQN